MISLLEIGYASSKASDAAACPVRLILNVRVVWRKLDASVGNTVDDVSDGWGTGRVRWSYQQCASYKFWCFEPWRDKTGQPGCAMLS